MIKVLIFGTGVKAQKIIDCLTEQVEIVAYLDNDKSKWGTYILGRPIISLKNIYQKEYDYIIIAAKEFVDIQEQLLDMGIFSGKLITPFAFQHLEYANWKDVFNLEKLNYLELNQRMETLEIYVNNLEYELASKLHRHKVVFPKIAKWQDAVYEIVYNGKSMSRYGDGEFNLILKRKYDFLNQSQELPKRLKEILISNLSNHIVCIPDVYGDYEGRTENFKTYFRSHLYNGGRECEYEILDLNKQYYDAFITRPYIDYIDKSDVYAKFTLLKSIWKNRNITIVEGQESRLGVGNDLFADAKSCVRILGPSTNAYEKYDEILNAVLKTNKDRLVLIALGATATVLAYDLAQMGYQALDIGHIDIEYEWFLRGATKAVAIDGKYVNEAVDGKCVEKVPEEESYYSQIIEKII